jgi:hypothetical protein
MAAPRRRRRLCWSKVWLQPLSSGPRIAWGGGGAGTGAVEAGGHGREGAEDAGRGVRVHRAAVAVGVQLPGGSAQVSTVQTGVRLL